jgi:hypothetical protein
MKSILLSAVFLTCVGTATMAQTMPSSALVYLDVDDNTQVSQGEFSGQMQMFFEPMDADGNGQLEYIEVESFISREIFDVADTNGNGAISSSEYEKQILRDFQNADVDGDGVLD